MSPKSIGCTLAGGAAFALAVLVSPAASAAQPKGAATTNGTPLVLAQATAPAVRSAGTPLDAFPAYQRGVREAAAQGPEALRRYIWRTRMIYNFYYDDFAPKE